MTYRRFVARVSSLALLSALVLLVVVAGPPTRASSGYVVTQRGAGLVGDSAMDFLGYATAMSADGNHFVTGAYGWNGSTGFVRAFDWNGSSWAQRGADLAGVNSNDYFGYAVAMSADGNRIVVGAFGNDNAANVAGQVTVYEWNGGAWGLLGAPIYGTVASQQFGVSVAISDDGATVVAGAGGNLVRIFRWDGASWAQLGTDILGNGSFDGLGASVAASADGDTVAAGAIYGAVPQANAGEVRVFDWDGSSWTQRGTDVVGTAGGDWFGYSVALSNDGTKFVAGGLFNDDLLSNAGHVRVFEWDGSAWTQLGSSITGQQASDFAGRSVAMSGDGTVIAVGSDGYQSPVAGLDAGQVRLFDWDGTSWTQRGTDIDGESSGDDAGISVAMSDDGLQIAVGEKLRDTTSFNEGRVRVFEVALPGPVTTTTSTTSTTTSTTSTTVVPAPPTSASMGGPTGSHELAATGARSDVLVCVALLLMFFGLLSALVWSGWAFGTTHPARESEERHR